MENLELTLPTKSKIRKWRVLAFVQLYFGGMGACCSILFCARILILKGMFSMNFSAGLQAWLVTSL